MNQEHVLDGGRGLKHTADVVAIAGLPAHFIGAIHLSDVYTLLGCAWLLFRICETKAFWWTVAFIRRRISR